MPDNCGRCNKFIASDDLVKLDLEKFHVECAIKEVEEEVDIPDYKMEKLREKVRKADELQFTRRGLQVIQ